MIIYLCLNDVKCNEYGVLSLKTKKTNILKDN